MLCYRDEPEETPVLQTNKKKDQLKKFSKNKLTYYLLLLPNDFKYKILALEQAFRGYLNAVLKFTGKHQLSSPVFSKASDRPTILLKYHSNARVLLRILRNFSEQLFHRTPLDTCFSSFINIRCKISKKYCETRTLFLLIQCCPANIYLFKATNRNTRKVCEIYSKLTIKIPERRN